MMTTETVPRPIWCVGHLTYNKALEIVAVVIKNNIKSKQMI